jgi:cell fate regulator YaaT (PSP1 superfamily)
MGCESCANGDGSPKGCRNNGTCSTGGCNKLEVFDWLSNMELPNGQRSFDCIEVRFKNSRKGFYRDINNLNLHVGDIVAVESSPGYDVGIITITGELARLQLDRKKPRHDKHEIRKLYRKAQETDVETWKLARSLEDETMFKSRKIASGLGLQMKISDVEYQGDKSKATFYYTADERVDFRELIKKLADEFKVRIEMRQIGARQESGRLGGIGSCGRELCCSSWLQDFRSVSTSAARYQQLSLNPQKLAGQCGKLKCCLNYELDMYIEAYKNFPDSKVRLETQNGTATHQKTDIFKKTMWYTYEVERASTQLIALKEERVAEIIEMNKNGKKPADLKGYTEVVEDNKPDYDNVVGQDSLTRFDDMMKKKRKKKRKKRPPKGKHHNQRKQQKPKQKT